MKKLIFAFIVLVIGLIFVISTYYKSESKKDNDLRMYVNENMMVYFVGGASKGDHYHREGCQYFSSIYRGRTKYIVDVTTAQKMGLIPCPTCNPPMPLRSAKEKEDLKKMDKVLQIKEEKEREQAALDYLKGGKNPNTKYKVFVDTTSAKEEEYINKIKEYVKK